MRAFRQPTLCQPSSFVMARQMAVNPPEGYSPVSGGVWVVPTDALFFTTFQDMLWLYPNRQSLSLQHPSPAEVYSCDSEPAASSPLPCGIMPSKILSRPNLLSRVMETDDIVTFKKIVMPIHITEDSRTIRMHADKCEVDDPAAARWLRRVAEIMDTPIGTVPSPDDE